MDAAMIAKMNQMQAEINARREEAHPADQYDRYECADCPSVIYIAKTASADDQVECGNCGAGYSVDFFRSMDQD